MTSYQLKDRSSGDIAESRCSRNAVEDRFTSADSENTQRYISLFGTRTRFVMMALLLFCLTSIWYVTTSALKRDRSNILTWNIGQICMHPAEHPNNTNSSFGIADMDTFEFDSDQQQYSISIVALTALLCNFPVVFLVSKIQIRTVFTGLGLLSGISTAFLPVAIRMGFVYVLVLRALQGLAFAAVFPVIGAFAAKWIYFKQSGLFVSALVANVQLAPAVTNPASGLLCGFVGWPSIFYAHGAVGITLFIIYGLFYRNSPQKCVFVSSLEMNKIAIGKESVDKRLMAKTPYAAILKSPVVWAIWIASLGNFACVNVLFLYSPQYLNRVLGFSAHKTGISAALPPLLMFAMKVSCGQLSDRIKFISNLAKFRLFNSLAFCGSAVFLMLLAAMPADNPSTKFICMLLLGGSAGILGAATGGFYKTAPMISKQYSHFVTGNISLGISITMLVVPFLVGGLTPENTAAQWRWVFLIIAVDLLLSNTFYCFLVTDKPAEWTKTVFVKPSQFAMSEPSYLKKP